MGRASRTKRLRHISPARRELTEHLAAEATPVRVVPTNMCMRCGRLARWPKRLREGEGAALWCPACVARRRRLAAWARMEGKDLGLYPEPYCTQMLEKLLDEEEAA